MDETQTLLRDITDFLSGQKMAESTFGKRAVNDGKLIARLKKGDTVSIVTAGKIRRFIAASSDRSAA